MTRSEHCFLDYARMKTYFLSTPHKKKFVEIVERSHSSCADHLYLCVYQDSKKKPQLYHCGEYCALTHASAELLCELFQSIHKNTFKKIVHHIIHTDSQSQFWDDYQDNDSILLLKEVLVQKMSETRRRCFKLAWEAAAKIKLITKE